MQPYPSGYPPAMPHQRPAGVAILAILQCIASLVFLLIGLAVAALGGLVLSQPGAGGLGYLFLAVGGVLFIVGLIGFAIGWGLWSLKPWARTVALIFAVLGLILGVASLAAGSVGSVVGVLIEFLILWYLTRPEVKAAFGLMPMGMPSPYGSPMAYAPPVMAQTPGYQMAPPVVAAAFCPQCGGSLPPGAFNCPSCGARVA